MIRLLCKYKMQYDHEAISLINLHLRISHDRIYYTEKHLTVDKSIKSRSIQQHIAHTVIQAGFKLKLF